MKNITIVPADTYTVINKSIITEQDRRIVSILYQPIIGYTATSLYFTLIDSLNEKDLMSEDLTHHHLMSNMQLKLEDIVIAREKLEAIGLLKTYMKKDNINQYVYCVYSPLQASDFFNHPVLNIVLYNNIGKKEYEKVLNSFKIPTITLRDYEDITSSFDEVFKSVKGSTLEIEEDLIKKNSNKLGIKKSIDFDLIEQSIPKTQISDKCFNTEIKELINQLSYIYELSTLDMQEIIRNSLNEKGYMDKTILRKSCRDYYQFENGGNLPSLIYNKQPDFLKKPEGDNSKLAKMIYTFENITPYQLLKAKYKGAEPTDRDKRLVESLLIDQKLNPGVVNVLISYVLKTNNEQLKKSYVETIAGQWKRSNVETVEEAMKIAEKYHKRMKKEMVKEKDIKKKPVKEEQLPVWFETDQDITDTTDEEVEELDKILKELV
ncbi:MAG: DnaD domain protein [Bacilli bacterium]|nr:DnaD domain protein [Bacilli bacterium]MBR6137502.1 DnaD domain protein [Bacilli bacterium]